MYVTARGKPYNRVSKKTANIFFTGCYSTNV